MGNPIVHQSKLVMPMMVGQPPIPAHLLWAELMQLVGSKCANECSLKCAAFVHQMLGQVRATQPPAVYHAVLQAVRSAR